MLRTHELNVAWR